MLYFEEFVYVKLVMETNSVINKYLIPLILCAMNSFNLTEFTHAEYIEGILD